MTPADGKSHRGEPDRSRVSGSELYEVDYFAKKHGLTRQQAEALIKQVIEARRVKLRMRLRRRISPSSCTRA